MFYIHIVGSCYHLNFNNFGKTSWMIRWLLIYHGLWMSIAYDLMGHYRAQWRVKINSVCLSRTRFVIRGNSRQYILIAGLQLSSYRSLQLSVYRLSSVDVRLASIISHLSISSSLFFTAMSTFASGRRLLPVGTAPIWCYGGRAS